MTVLHPFRSVVDVATGAVRALTGKTNFEAHPTFSPDGSRIAFWRPRADESNNVNIPAGSVFAPGALPR